MDERYCLFCTGTIYATDSASQGTSGAWAHDRCVARSALQPARCSVPPAGWTCSRDAGHEGPCAATGVDGEAFNLGRAEGRADVAVMLRKAVDPEDRNHWNLDGTLAEVRRLKERETPEGFVPVPASKASDLIAERDRLQAAVVDGRLREAALLAERDAAREEARVRHGHEAEMLAERDQAIEGECARAVERDAARAEAERLRYVTLELAAGDEALPTLRRCVQAMANAEQRADSNEFSEALAAARRLLGDETPGYFDR